MFRDLWLHKKKWVIGGGIVLLIAIISIFMIIKQVRINNLTKKANEADQTQTSGTTTDNAEFDKLQARMEEKHGKAPDGMYYDEDGELMPYGDPDMTPEEVAATYIRSLSTLNLNEAKRYSYTTTVLKTFEGYYERSEQFTYQREFTKEMYKQVLISMQPLEVQDTALFAEGKTIVTLDVNLLDLTNKDFWKDDAQKVYLDLFQYKRTESDPTKAKEYLYTYVLDYYKSEKPKKRDVTVSLTLEKTGNGGWVVTNDDQIDAYCKYREGEVVVSNILTSYEDWSTQIEDERLQRLLEETGRVNAKKIEVGGSSDTEPISSDEDYEDGDE